MVLNCFLGVQTQVFDGFGVLSEEAVRFRVFFHLLVCLPRFVGNDSSIQLIKMFLFWLELATRFLMLGMSWAKPMFLSKDCH